MKTTFITTVFNEEKTIISLLQSLITQSVLPDEIIIVDAKSSDRTVDLAKKFLTQTKIPFNIISKKGNRSVGRNLAIKRAKYSLILASDAGCTLDKNWIKNISKPFENRNVSVVSGYYQATSKNSFQKCLAAYTSVLPENLNPETFLPSTRSIAFRKSVWKSVRGFPENLDTCEDMIFDKKLKEKNYTFIFAKNAIVFWPQRENMLQAFMQFYRYAFGDGLAHYFRLQTPFLFLRYLLGITIFTIAISTHSKILLFLLVILFVLYLIWSVYKNYKSINLLSALYILPTLQIASDIAVLLGTTAGFIKSFTRHS